MTKGLRASRDSIAELWRTCTKIGSWLRDTSKKKSKQTKPGREAREGCAYASPEK